MNGFVPLKEILAKDVIKRAKDLAWDTFPKEAQEAFLKLAKEAQDAYSQALALKCLKEAEDAFNEPGFISRADPRAYSDHPESETAKQRARRKK
jgi:TRAP-type C4-dicarboxylate transport system substrate-binding protein